MLIVIKKWSSFLLPIGVRVNRDDYMALAQTWNIFGIPSFVVTQNGQELGRLVNKARKTKEEITAFLETL